MIFRGNCKTPRPRKTSLLAPLVAVPPRPPYWVGVRQNGASQQADFDKGRQNHQFFGCGEFCNCLFHRLFRKPSSVASLPRVSFATTVWEKDWRQILLDPEYLPIRQVQNHCFPFGERLLIINNVNDLAAVKQAASYWIDRGVLSRIIVAAENAEEVLSFFQLRRSDFRMEASSFENVNDDWIYYNALGPLTAIYYCGGEYLLYLTGDVYLPKPLSWIAPALEKMEKTPFYWVANPIWNGKVEEVQRESYRKEGAFYVAREGFSDQIFLVKKDLFRQPIYGEIRTDAAHFPRGDVFEKRVFSYLKNRQLERIIYKHGSYTHENF